MVCLVSDRHHCHPHFHPTWRAQVPSHSARNPSGQLESKTPPHWTPAPTTKTSCEGPLYSSIITTFGQSPATSLTLILLSILRRVKALKNHLQLVQLSRHLPHFFFFCLLIHVVRLITYVSIRAKSVGQAHYPHPISSPIVVTASVRSHLRWRHYCSLEISYPITSRASTTFVHHYLTFRAGTSPHLPFTYPISLLHHHSQHEHPDWSNLERTHFALSPPSCAVRPLSQYRRLTRALTPALQPPTLLVSSLAPLPASFSSFGCSTPFRRQEAGVKSWPKRWFGNLLVPPGALHGRARCRARR